jgi:O-antigen/teichoic acid export membrane protein
MSSTCSTTPFVGGEPVRVRARGETAPGAPASGAEPGSGPAVALAWSFTNTAVARFGTIAIGIVLARILGPAEFGTYAVAFVALMAILSFNELGVSLAIVRWPNDPAEIAPTVNAISISMSALLTGVMILGAPWFAAAMGDPGAAPLVQLLSVCVLVNGAVATPAALMQRLFRQDQRMVADQVNVWVGALVSIALAVLGLGAASLVAGRLAGATLPALVFLHYSPLPYRLGLDRRFTRQLLAFGVPLAGASLVVFLVGFADQLAVGTLLGPVALGYYVLACNLANWPVTLFSQPLRSVAPALFARLQHDPEAMRAAYPRVLRPLAAVALPACVGLAVVAPDAVRLVYGEEWMPAAGILRWLALVAAARILFELCYDYLVVLGRSRAILRLQLVWLVVLVPSLVGAVREWGEVGAAVALLAVSVLVSMPLYLVELARVGVRPAVVGRAVLPSAVASALMVGALLVSDRGWATWLGLAWAGVLLASTVAVLVWRTRSDLSVFRSGTPA